VEGEVAPGELQMFAQTLAAAIRQPPQTSQVPSNGAITAPPKPQAEQPDLFNDIEPEIEAEPEGESPLPPKPQNGSKKKLRTPQLVSGLEFKSGEKSLEDYIREIDPKEHSKRYLAITYWLRQYRNLAEVSGDHVYTCYRSLGLNVPKDVGSIFRALKSQEWVEPGSKGGFYKITHIGENQLTKGKE